MQDQMPTKERKQFNFVQSPSDSPPNVKNNHHLRHIMKKHAQPSRNNTPSGKRKHSLSLSSHGISYQAPAQQHMLQMMNMMNRSRPPSPISTNMNFNKNELRICVNLDEDEDAMMYEDKPKFVKSASLDTSTSQLHPGRAHFKVPSH